MNKHLFQHSEIEAEISAEIARGKDKQKLADLAISGFSDCPLHALPTELQGQTGGSR